MASAVDTYVKWPVKLKVLLWVAIAVVVGAIYYFTGFAPKAKEIRKLESQYIKLGEEVAAKKAIADNLPKVKEEVRLLDESLALAVKKLPNSEEIPELLRTVADLGEDSGLEFVLFKPDKPVPKDFYAEVPLKLENNGTYHDLATFFDKVGRLPRIVTINNIKVVAENKQDPSSLKASYEAKTFRFLTEAERKAQQEAKNKAKRRGKGGRK